MIPTACICGYWDTDLIGSKDERTVGTCKACGMLRTLEMDDNYEDLYVDGEKYHAEREGQTPYKDRYYHDYHIAELRWPNMLRRFHPRLLDVGAANGAFVRHAIDHGFNAEGLELNPNMAGWAMENFTVPMHTSWDTVGQYYDVVTYHDVIEHVVDPYAELVTLSENHIIKPYGLLILDTPDAEDPRFKELGMDWHHMKPKEHLFFFTEKHLVDMLKRADYKILQVDRPIPGKIVAYAEAPS
jgi:2-polyprenyl-3-methyl-5-hydroxy-6-metoxy-1,4-benzoquinol methylase